MFASLIEYAIAEGASDIHLQPGHSPFLRIGGKQKMATELSPVRKEEIVQVLESLINEEQKAFFEQHHSIRFVVKTSKGRLRICAYKTRKQIGLQIRLLSLRPVTISDGNYPTSLENLANLQSGLVLICGSRGSGKSTLLRAMQIAKKNGSISSLEDPIEIPWKHPSSLLCQQEVQTDGLSLKNLLDFAVQCDFEMITLPFTAEKNLVQSIITAATSKLVLLEIDASTEIDAIQRLVQHLGVTNENLSILSRLLKGVAYVRLVPVKNDKVLPVTGVIVFNRSCSDAVMKNHLHELNDLVRKNNAGSGSQNLDIVLGNMVDKKEIALEVALRYATNPSLMKLQTTGIIHTE